jgi:hypothetical protein
MATRPPGALGQDRTDGTTAAYARIRADTHLNRRSATVCTRGPMTLTENTIGVTTRRGNRRESSDVERDANARTPAPPVELLYNTSEPIQ